MIDDHDPNAIALDEARTRIVDALASVSGSERLPLGVARGRLLYRDLVAPMDVPPFRSSAMDGYAIRHADIGCPLRIVDRSLAGHPSGDTLEPGTCHRITTGARIADDADTVVQQENVSLLGDVATIDVPPTIGLHVREAGSDSRRGSILLEAATVLGAAALAMLAAHGVHEVDVRRRVRVGLLSTGDELREPDASLARGQIHDANRILLSALLESPDLDIVDLGIARDTQASLVEAIGRVAGLDAIVSTGGVSVGDADHVREVLGGAGRIDLWKIAMKPGRPLAFGFLTEGTAWFGLPGNPVSAAVTALLILRPALARLAGKSWIPPRPRSATLTTTLRKLPGRMEFQRGVTETMSDGRFLVHTTGAQDSHVLRSLQLADCLIELPTESRGAAAGDEVAIYLLDELGERAL